MKKVDCIQCWKEFEKLEWHKLWNICSLRCRDTRYYANKPRKKYYKYKTYDCVICWESCKVIDDYRVKWISENKVCKNKECKMQHRRNTDNKMNDKNRDAIHFLNKKTDSNNTEDTFFADNKELYSDKLIDHDSSPTWKAYIWIAKKPLMKNDNWIWYKWVLLQSENRNLVQCSECWKWYKIIPTKHLESHWLTREQYKEKYWLNKTQSLVSDTYSRFYASNLVNVVWDSINNVPKGKREEWLKNEEKQWRKKEKKNIIQIKWKMIIERVIYN